MNEPTVTEVDKYFAMVDEIETAMGFAIAGNINAAMISAAKSTAIYKYLKHTGILNKIAGDDPTSVEHISKDFSQEVAAEAYLSIAENCVKNMDIRSAQINYFLIMPGTKLRAILEGNGAAEEVKVLDNILF